MNSFLDNLSQFFQREHLVSPTMNNHSMGVRAHNSHIGPGIDFRFLSQGAHRVQVRASSKPPQRSLKPQNWFLGTAAGPALGLLAWGADRAAWLPLTGVDLPPWKEPTPKVLLPVLDHAVFGAAWGL